MTLVEFLLARIAEDEADAQHAIEQEGAEWEWDGSPIGSVGANGWSMACDLYSDVGAHVARWDPARVLIECDVKRQIIKLHGRDHECSVFDHNGEIDNCRWVTGGDCSTLRLYAALYVDHLDFQEEWKP